jgi:hypothetical protein
MTPLLIKGFFAAAAIGGNLIARAVTAGQVNAGAAQTDALIGVTDQMGAEAGRMVDVVQVGWGELRLGGSVAFGALLTSDNQGRGVTAAPVAGVVVRTIGVAMSDGVSGDIIPVFIMPGAIATPAA